jgi:hypothetical protein
MTRPAWFLVTLALVLPLCAADHDHALDTWRWVLRLDEKRFVYLDVEEDPYLRAALVGTLREAG